MSNKPFKKLNPIDQKLRRLFPPRMNSDTEEQVVIRKISGFELFNTRPHHNYETWSDGYEVEAKGFKVQAEDLDDAIDLLEKKVTYRVD